MKGRKILKSVNQLQVLTEKQKQDVMEFVNIDIKKIKSFNKNIGSYGLKHIISDCMDGLYMTTKDMAEIMDRCGFKLKPTGPYSSGETNFDFNMSSMSLKNLYKMRDEALKRR